MLSYSLNSLIVFYEVARLNSFSKAAGLLSITQPSVSKHVAQLEAQMGIKLMKRENGAIGLTKDGRTVFRYAKNIEKWTRGLEGLRRSMAQHAAPCLKVATTPVYSTLMVPFILGTFQKNNPGTLIKLDTGSSNELVSTVLAMENDVVIVGGRQSPKKNIAAFPLVTEELILIAPWNHPLAARESVSLREIAGYPLIIREKGSATRKVVLSAIQSMNAKPSALIEMKSTDFIKEWVSQGKDISIMIKRAVSEDDLKHFKAIPLQEKLSLDVFVVFLKSRKCDLAIQAFLRHVEELKAKHDL